jgi:hypothetical protein
MALVANVFLDFRVWQENQEPPRTVVASKKQQTAQGAVRVAQILMSRVDVFQRAVVT